MKFTKMQGLGNDYVYVNCFKEKIADPSALAEKISDRWIGRADHDQSVGQGGF